MSRRHRPSVAVRGERSLLIAAMALVACTSSGDSTSVAEKARLGTATNREALAALPVALDFSRKWIETSDRTASNPPITAGSLTGAFEVTRDGQATYRIPLWVPPGRAGLDGRRSEVVATRP